MASSGPASHFHSLSNILNVTCPKELWREDEKMPSSPISKSTPAYREPHEWRQWSDKNTGLGQTIRDVETGADNQVQRSNPRGCWSGYTLTGGLGDRNTTKTRGGWKQTITQSKRYYIQCPAGDAKTLNINNTWGGQRQTVTHSLFAKTKAKMLRPDSSYKTTFVRNPLLRKSLQQHIRITLVPTKYEFIHLSWKIGAAWLNPRGGLSHVTRHSPGLGGQGLHGGLVDDHAAVGSMV